MNEHLLPGLLELWSRLSPRLGQARAWLGDALRPPEGVEVYVREIVEQKRRPSEVVAINNLIVGTGVFSWGASGLFEGNRHATFGMLRDAETYAFELAPGSMWRHSGADPRNVRGHDLSPQAEFEWPTGVRLLPGGRDRWSPGAFQR